jgi:hypothetical protein
MKKALSILISLAVGAALGFAIGSMISDISNGESSAMSKTAEIGLMLVALALGAYLQIILHEAGHLVCGLLSGYNFVSFRIGSLTLLKDENGKLRFKRFKVAGTGGQCLMSPPEGITIDKLPTSLYNAGGVLMNLLCATVSLLLLLFCDNMHFFIKYLLATTVVTGYAFALLNGIPLKFSGVSNDGYNLLYIKRNNQSLKGFQSQLIINEKLQNGTRLSQMPDNLFDLGGEIDYSDPMQANVEIMRVSRVMDQGDMEQAKTLFKELLQFHQHELLALLRFEAENDMLFTILATGEMERAQILCNDKMLMKYITKYAQVMTSKQRTLMAKTLILDGDRATAKQMLDTAKTNSKKYLMQGEVKSDILLMEKLLEDEKDDSNQANLTN